MKIENRTPHQDGFYMPGEFEPQDGVILIWPKRPGSWPYEAKEAGKVFAEIANKLAETEKVYMLTEPETEAAAREELCIRDSNNSDRRCMGKGCRTNLCDGWKRSPWGQLEL